MAGCQRDSQAVGLVGDGSPVRVSIIDVYNRYLALCEAKGGESSLVSLESFCGKPVHVLGVGDTMDWVYGPVHNIDGVDGGASRVGVRAWVDRRRDECGNSESGGLGVELSGGGGVVGCQDVDASDAAQNVVGVLDGFARPVGGGCAARVTSSEVSGHRCDVSSASAGVSPVVGAKTEANRERRRKKKERKLRRQGMAGVSWRADISDSSSVLGNELQLSLEAKWKAQNAVAKFKAEQELELLQSKDMEQLKKVQRTALVMRTEKNMVAVEKAHQSLKYSGNVPGYAQTVSGVSGTSASALSPGECSISPSSSVSEAEFRRMVKELEDLKKECELLREQKKAWRFGKLEDGDEVPYTADGFTDKYEDELRAKFEGIRIEGNTLDESTLYVRDEPIDYYDDGDY